MIFKMIKNRSIVRLIVIVFTGRILTNQVNQLDFKFGSCNDVNSGFTMMKTNKFITLESIT